MGIIKKKGKSGAATNYISRNQALKKLQLSLAAFRRLCILKGIYPREPSNKKKVGGGSTAPKTYYYRKDIQYLLHEPLVQKFRDYKIYARKLKKAVLKKDYAHAKALKDFNRPVFTLDHIIKERYPTFSSAIRDLDDALGVIFLFATLPCNDLIEVAKIRECERLAQEFQTWVSHSRSLRKTFISVKGIYYQAEIQGQDVTWVVPHQFTQNVPADVDFKIMGTFLDLYISLLGFVNYKLYTDSNLVYPPKLDKARDGQAAGIKAFLLESASESNLINIASTTGDSQAELNGVKRNKKTAQKQKMALEGLDDKIASIIQENSDDEESIQGSEEETEDQEMTDIPEVCIDEDEEQDETKLDNIPSLADIKAASTSKSQFQNLYNGCFFWLSRETPRDALEFIITSFGGQVGWDDNLDDEKKVKVSPYLIDDSRITHHIVDRPLPVDGSRADWMAYERREYLLPQWIFDCVNAKKLLKTDRYHPGDVLPPHLSPFVKYEEGDYIPEEANKIFGVSAVSVKKGLVSDEPIERTEKVEEVKEQKNGNKKDKKDVVVIEQEEVESDTEEVKQTKSDLEKKELAKMMMTKKDKRLYEQIQYGKRKREAEAEALQNKKERLSKKKSAGWKVTQ